MLKKIVIALSLSLMISTTSAQNNLQIPRAQSAPQLVEFVSGVPANVGLKIQDFKQRTPGDGTPASQETSAYLSYDDTHFYAVFVAKDDPAKIRARIAKREDFEGDDFVILELDTFHDKRRAFTFFVNPYGVQLDSKRTEGFDPDNNFDTQWESDGQLTDYGYVTRMAIPLKSLRFKNADVQTWGVAVGRLIARLNEASYWPHITMREAGFVPQFAGMTIPEKLSSGRNAQLNPFVFLGNSRSLNTDDLAKPRWQQENKRQVGLDAKWVLGDASAIDITLKPDFSEVESDEPQIVIDKRYEVLFPEKRPFFLENASFFQTPTPLFFSRRISQPQAGVRITGREGAWAYGGLLIDDQAAGEDANTKAHIAMARVQNDVNHDVSIGGIVTNRRLADARDTVAGIDGRYQWDDNWIFQSQFARSQAQKDDVSQRGHLNFFEAKHVGKELEMTLKYLDVSEYFAESLAFLPRTDVKQVVQEAKYQWHLDGHNHWQKLGAILHAEIARNQANQLQDWEVNAGVFVEASRDSWFEVLTRHGFETYGNRDCRKQGWLVNTGTSWFDWLTVKTEFGMMDSINYTPAEGIAAFMGKGRSVDLTLTFKPHPQWRLEEKLLWNDLQSSDLVTPNTMTGTVYRNLMWRTKLSYQHNRFLGLRVIADYHQLASNPRLSSLQSGKQLNTDVQVSYLLAPGTSVIAGYGNRQENLALLGNPQHLRRTEELSLRTGRRAFVKLNYLYQL
ncbi:DUF5916 domain-containing protein [Undibacterium sp.]|uniref:carbohydrate binding family 9 domain-containing protein n=1 Tax=Undibacterium sp. TaxID=1914977 RepID=UPI00374FEBAF